jgi:hypothetical protein
LNGWTPAGQGTWSVTDGAITPNAGPAGSLRTNLAYTNFILRLEFKGTAETNSGVFIRSAPTGPPQDTGYEVQIWDKHPQFPTGSIVGMAATKEGKINPGQWQSMEIRAEGEQISVSIDGKNVLNTTQTKSSGGHVVLQYNANSPVAFRSLRLRQLR